MDRGRLLQRLRGVVAAPPPPPVWTAALDRTQADVDSDGRSVDASRQHTLAGAPGAWTVDGVPVRSDCAPVWSASWARTFYVAYAHTVWEQRVGDEAHAVINLTTLQLPGERVVHGLQARDDAIVCWFDRYAGWLFEGERAFAYLWELDMTSLTRTLSPRRKPGNAITDKIDEAMVLLVQARQLALDTEPIPPIPPDGPTIPVSAGTPLQPVIDSAPEGSILALAAGHYAGPIYLRQAITLQPATPIPAGRATAVGYGVVLDGTAEEDTITVLGDHVTLRGILATTCDARRQVVGFLGTHLLLDRCTLRGDPTVGAHRGLMLNGVGAQILQCHIDNVFDVGRDTQAISGWDGTRDVVIDDCYLAAGGETVMFGGADSTSEERMPTNIRITHSTLTKDPSWFAKGVQIKNALELKACSHFEMSDCVLEYGGISEGQGGYVILLSVRNQDGTAPWSTVQHVRIERCHARYGGSGLKITGRDDGQASVPLDDVVFDHVAFTDLDPQGITKGDGRGICFVAAPDGVTIHNVTLAGQHMGASLYMDQPYSRVLTLQNIKLCPSEYGMKLDGGGMGVAAWQAAMPEAVINDVSETAAGAGT